MCLSISITGDLLYGIQSEHTATETGFLNNVYVLSHFETRHKYSHLSRCPGESTLCCAKTLHHVQFFVTLWTVARPLYPWDSPSKNTGMGLPCPPPGDLPNPGYLRLMSPALVGGFFTSNAPGKPFLSDIIHLFLTHHITT